MKKVRSSPVSSKPQSPAEAPAGPPHPHLSNEDATDPAGVAAPQQPPSELPEYLRPPFALRSDAVLLLSVEQFANVDLTGRRLWTGVELTPEEEEIVRTRALNMEHETASLIVVRLPKRTKPDEN